jgi:hypothetical protein
MDYERSTSTLAKNAKKTTLIWGNDGWCYIPELKIRQRFTEKKYYQEDWEGVIAMPENIEFTQRAVLSKEPLIWQEDSETYSTIKKKKIPSTKKSSPHLQD